MLQANSTHIIIASCYPAAVGRLTKETTKRTCSAQNGEIIGEVRDWAYSKPALVAREIISSSEERYPVIRGEDIDGITVTDYKLEVCWKDKSRPTMIFLLKDDFIRCTEEINAFQTSVPYFNNQLTSK